MTRNTLNRFERERLMIVFLAIAAARGTAWTYSVMRPIRGADGEPVRRVGDMPDVALLAIVSQFGGASNPTPGVRVV